MTQAVSRDARLDDDGDPWQAIVDAQTQQFAEELEAMKSDSDSETEPESDETSLEPSTSGKETGTAAERKRPGIDRVLREVDTKLGRSAGDVIRGVLTNYQQSRTSLKSMQDRLEKLEDALSPKEEPGAEATPEDPRLANLTPQQLELAEAMMRKLGYVKQDDLKQAEMQKSQSDYIQAEVSQAMQDWGEEFGRLDEDGQFVFSPAVLDDVNQVYERIYDPTRGLTSRDLYVLARWQELAKGGSERARAAESQQLARQQKLSAIQRGVTERRSSPGRAREQVRREGDTLDDVVARSFAAALRENAR